MIGKYIAQFKKILKDTVKSVVRSFVHNGVADAKVFPLFPTKFGSSRRAKYVGKIPSESISPAEKLKTDLCRAVGHEHNYRDIPAQCRRCGKLLLEVYVDGVKQEIDTDYTEE